MRHPWSDILSHIDGPRLWITIDLSIPRPALAVHCLSDSRYLQTVIHLALLNGLTPIDDRSFDAPLPDQIADAMIDLAFLNRHGTPDEGFVPPRHWLDH